MDIDIRVALLSSSHLNALPLCTVPLSPLSLACLKRTWRIGQDAYRGARDVTIHVAVLYYICRGGWSPVNLGTLEPWNPSPSPTVSVLVVHNLLEGQHVCNRVDG